MSWWFSDTKSGWLFHRFTVFKSAWRVTSPPSCDSGSRYRVQMEQLAGFPAESRGSILSLTGLSFSSQTQFFHSCPSRSPLSPSVWLLSFCSPLSVLLSLAALVLSLFLFFIFLSLSVWPGHCHHFASEACFRECHACDAVLFWHVFPPTLFSGLNPLIPCGMSCWRTISSQVCVCVCVWKCIWGLR